MSIVAGKYHEQALFLQVKIVLSSANIERILSDFGTAE